MAAPSLTMALRVSAHCSHARATNPLSGRGQHRSAPPQPHSRAGTGEVRTPHSGYHYDGRPGRFFEGWYFKVYIPEEDTSFALIYSIEDPANDTKTAGVGAQIMGPDDGYLLQYSKDVDSFWASARELQLGATFRPAPRSSGRRLERIVPEEEFCAVVQEGFQASDTFHQGRIVRAESGASGDLLSTVDEAQWSFTVAPRTGWGPAAGDQKATAGWLAALPVFEPHWQILMSHGEATGATPSLGEPGLSLTTGGGTRAIPLVPGLEEDVALLCVHYRGEFIELVPWTSEVQWAIEPWGSWKIWGRSDKYEALVEASTDKPGTPLRAPTPDEGLAPFCRDTFAGTTRLRIWERDVFGMRKPIALVDATSTSAALEVGGGPWWSSWKASAEMKEPLRSFLNLPIDSLLTAIPGGLRPPGL
eukprot:jgi/Tetstr1/442518/TSEL_030616.t1